MEIRGKIIQKLEPVSGTSKQGNAWNKQEYVLETEEAYPKKVHFDFFGDKANQYVFEIGDRINLSFDIESREYNNRWYTSIRGWKGEKVTDNAPQASQAPQSAIDNSNFIADTDFSAENSSDDMPF